MPISNADLQEALATLGALLLDRDEVGKVIEAVAAKEPRRG